jgi:hypothetical protein
MLEASGLLVLRLFTQGRLPHTIILHGTMVYFIHTDGFSLW